MIYLSTPDRFPPGPLRERAHRLALKGLGGGVFYGLVIEPRWLETTWIDFPVPGLPHSLDGYRIVHLTDIHHNLVTGRRYLERVIARANALEPDLVALTGDYITHNPQRFPAVAEWLGRLRARDGIVATLGNHDYQWPIARVRKLFHRYGIHLLEDEHHVIFPRRKIGREEGDGVRLPSVPPTPITMFDARRREKSHRGVDRVQDRRPRMSEVSHRMQRLIGARGFRQRWREWRTSRTAYMHLDPEKYPVHHHPAQSSDTDNPCLCVIGIGDLWEGECDLTKALEGAPHGGFRLLLSHNPEVAHLVSSRDRVGLMLSGHTHGGQTWLFHRSPLRREHLRRYLRGMVRAHATNVYISRGIGSSAFHFRWNCRPEVTLIRLLRADSPSPSDPTIA